jgi:hypothetical protein
VQGNRLPNHEKVRRMLSNLEARSTLEVECAERELIGIAVRKPELWSRLSHIQPEWFQRWADQALWRALQFCKEANDGNFDADVIKGWLRKYSPDDAEALLDRLAEISSCYLHAEHLEFNLHLLEGAGRRLATVRWAKHIAEMCEHGRPMADVYDVINTPPVASGGAV